MKRFFIEQQKIKGQRAVLEGSEARHVGRVLRMAPGDTVRLFDGQGNEYEAVIVAKYPTMVEVEIFNTIPLVETPPSEVIMGQSLPRAHKMDFIVEKATELGVATIIPFFSRRSVPLLDSNRAARRHERWQKVAIESAKLCGRTMVPRVEKILSFEELLGYRAENLLKIMLWEDEKITTLKKLFKSCNLSRRVMVLVGPEGGFTMDEVEKARETGFITVSLGKYIVRTETAGLCFLSILHYEWGS